MEKNSLENKINKFDNQINELQLKIGNDREYDKEFKSLKNKITKQKKKIEKELAKIYSKYHKLQSKQNQRLKKIFKNSVIIPENEIILKAAYNRFLKHNPPYDFATEDKAEIDNSKFGDCIIWESLLAYFKIRSNQSSELIFIARDGNAWGKNNFDNWLLREFRDATKGSIVYGKSIADIKELTQAEQEKIKRLEQEELKEDTINIFLLGGAYAYVGRKIEKITEFKELLTLSDYEKIIRGSLSNPDIYKSIYAPYALKKFLENPKNLGYVLPIIESIDYELWDRFNKRFGLELNRQSDEISKTNIKDVPF